MSAGLSYTFNAVNVICISPQLGRLEVFTGVLYGILVLGFSKSFVDFTRSVWIETCGSRSKAR